MTTIQQLIDELIQVEDKSQEIGIWCGGRFLSIAGVGQDEECVYLEPEEKQVNIIWNDINGKPYNGNT
jgi:hypothetical protein